MRYPIITKEVKILLKLLADDCERVELINALIDYGEDGELDTDGLSDNVCEAFIYLTENVNVLFWGDGDVTQEDIKRIRNLGYIPTTIPENELGVRFCCPHCHKTAIYEFSTGKVTKESDGK